MFAFCSFYDIWRFFAFISLFNNQTLLILQFMNKKNFSICWNAVISQIYNRFISDTYGL